MACGWVNPPGTPFDVDLLSFGVAEDGKLRTSKDFVYWRNVRNRSETIRLVNDARGGAGAEEEEVLEIELYNVPDPIHSVILIVNICKAQQRNQLFRAVKEV